MRAHILLALFMVISLPMLAQTGVDDSITDAPAPDQSEMMIPPPVSNEAYVTVVGTEERSNYLRLGMTVSGGYIRNLYPGTVGSNINEATYLLQPLIEFDRTGTRLHSVISYSPSFGWYQVPKVVNTTDQDATANVQLRLSPHVSLLVDENFRKMSTAFGQTTANFQTAVTGGAQIVTPGIYGLFEPQVSNESSAVLSWQFSRDDMIAGSARIGTLHFTNPTQSGGLYNTNAQGGSGSWTHRAGARQYVGGLYQLSFVQAKPAGSAEIGSSDTHTDNLFAFYTTYLTPHLSLSVQGGGQFYTISERPDNAHDSAWSPGGSASVGWQGPHTAFAMSYDRLVTAGQGILDAFRTDSVAAVAHWQMARTWTAGFDSSYSRLSNVTGLPGAVGYGHSVSGGVTVGHKITPSLQMNCNYDRIHESYGNIPSISRNPDTDRVLFSVSYALSRPIGQ